MKREKINLVNDLSIERQTLVMCWLIGAANYHYSHCTSGRCRWCVAINDALTFSKPEGGAA